MTRWTDHNDTERMVMLQQTADAEGLPEYAVEKDWWGHWLTSCVNRCWLWG